MEEQYSLTYLDTTHPITMDRFRMILTNPAAQTKGWVIVEGEADNIAYSRFLNGTDRMVMKAGYTAKDNTEGTIHVSNVWHDIHCQYEFKNSHYWMHTQHQFLSDADWKKNLYDFYCAECKNLPQPISFTQSMLSDTILHFDLKVEKISDFGRGHDFLRILSNVMVQTSSYGEKALTQYMIDACTADIFSHTHLYSAIKSWQTDKHVSIVI